MGTILPLDAFIVNLADKPDTRYLKVTIQLELERPDVSDELTGKMPRIRDALLILLTSKDYESIRTIEGKLQLRDEILDRVNMLLQSGKVKTAYFTDFVVQ
jgi:flagellar FliL protein